MSKWQKGRSGNPSGRPKGSRNKSTAEIKELLSELVSFDALVLKLIAAAMRGNTRAAELLLSYRFGKPTARLEVDAAGPLGSEDMARKANEILSRLTETPTEKLREKLLSRLPTTSRAEEN